jgi:hypothetical protein
MMSVEAKLLIGVAILMAGYYGPGSTGRVMPELLKMVGGVVIAGAARDMFWPPYQELPKAMMKSLREEVMGEDPKYPKDDP